MIESQVLVALVRWSLAVPLTVLTLTGIARVRLTDPPQVINGPRSPTATPRRCLSPSTLRRLAHDRTHLARLQGRLERFAQDTSQAACKRESWSRLVHLVDDSKPQRAAALADAIICTIGAEHADELGESAAQFQSSLLPLTRLIPNALLWNLHAC